MGIVAEAIEGLKQLPLWWSQSFSKRDPRLWTFGAWDGMRYSDNSRALYEYVLSHCPELKAVWMTKSQSVYDRLKSQDKPVAICDSAEGRSFQRQSGYFFLTKGPQDSDPRLMHGCHLVWLWHGMPLKQIGQDAMNFQRKNTFWKKVKTTVRRLVVPWEFLGGETLSTAPFFTPFLQSAFALRADEVWEFGYPRNDRFFNNSVTESLIERLHSQFDEASRPARLALYMPTHRDQTTREGHAFDPFSLAAFDSTLVEKVLEEQNILLLYKGHFFDSANEGLKESRRIITITDDDYDDMYTFIKDVDILITDYSSIYFDFLLCRKPIVLFPFDEADYVAHSRPFYFDYKLMGAPRCYSWPQLMQVLSQPVIPAPTLQEVNRFMLHTDGKTCQRIVAKVMSSISQN